MRLGLLPSQKRELQRAFKKADAFDHFRQRTRRTFLGVGALAVALGVGGFAAGRMTGAGRLADRDAVADPKLTARRDQARRLATQPDSILRRDHATFLLILDAVGDDEALWVGFARLGNMALQGEGDRQLMARLLTTARARRRPAYLDPLVETLRDRVR